MRNEQLLRRHALQQQQPDAEVKQEEDVDRKMGGGRPWRCEACGKRFVHRGDLNFHRKTTHDPNRQRYKCRVCGRQFNRHCNMLRHADIHRAAGGGSDADTDEQRHAAAAYACDICGCQYNFISSLTRHIVNNHMKPQQYTIAQDVDGDVALAPTQLHDEQSN